MLACHIAKSKQTRACYFSEYIPIDMKQGYLLAPNLIGIFFTLRHGSSAVVVIMPTPCRWNETSFNQARLRGKWKFRNVLPITLGEDPALATRTENIPRGLAHCVEWNSPYPDIRIVDE